MQTHKTSTLSVSLEVTNSVSGTPNEDIPSFCEAHEERVLTTGDAEGEEESKMIELLSWSESRTKLN